MDIQCLYPGAKRKAFTLSYDDGVCQDRRLVAMFNQYKVKATFNLNSGRQSYANGWTHPCGLEIRHLPAEEVVSLYAGHEVAVHTVNHPHLESLTPAEIISEVRQDRLTLEDRFGSAVEGMAYPFGTFSDQVVDCLKACGIVYSRTVISSGRFDIPRDWLRLEATCHHNDPRLMDLAKKFVEEKSSEPRLFYLWGHSYEFEANDNWNVIEDFAAYMGGREEIWYATNIEIYDYVDAYKRLTFSTDGRLVHNPTAYPLYFATAKGDYCVKPGEMLKL